MMPFEWDVRVSSKDHTVTAPTFTTRPATAGYTTLWGTTYVGSASGEANGLWQRWAAYAHLKNLTGGNRELERMRLDFGDGHIVGNFQYSILEIFDPKTKDEVILKREAFWKQALDSRAHGMNLN